MIEQVNGATAQFGGWLYAIWDGICRRLQALRLLPSPPEIPELLESAVQRTLRPVEPSASFRQHLRSSLEIALEHQNSGLVIEYPSLLNQRIVLGVSAGIVAAAVATLVLMFRPHTNHGKR